MFRRAVESGYLLFADRSLAAPPRVIGERAQILHYNPERAGCHAELGRLLDERGRAPVGSPLRL